MKNQNWFDSMVRNRWTVKAIRCTFGVNSIIAKQIQDCAWQRQSDAEAIASASRELCNQIGF